MSVSKRISLVHIKDLCTYLWTKKHIYPPLGRWSIDKNKDLNLIIDYANEDHCGSCGDYIHKKKEENMNYINSEKYLEYEYSCMTLNNPTKK